MSQNHQLSINRLEAFCDGVFAIAITLLILEIKIPSHSDIENAGGLYNFIVNLWPTFFAYVFSFLVIGIYWANHHSFLSMFIKSDHIFNMLNVLLLMFIAFLPYPTALLGDFISDPNQRHTVISFYALGIWLPSISWFLIWLYGKNKAHLINSNVSDETKRRLTQLYILSNGLYCFAFVISFINSFLSLGICVILTMFYLLPQKNKNS